MFSKKEYTDHLARVPLFAACSDKELAAIARAATEIDVPQGRVLTTQGRVAHEAFVLLEGTATVERNHQKVADLGPGDTIGELGLLADVPRTATVTTTSACKVLAFSPLEFAQALTDVPSLARSLLKVLAHRVADLDAAHFA